LGLSAKLRQASSDGKGLLGIAGNRASLLRALSGVGFRFAAGCRMNAHYDVHGLVGNPNMLRWLLGRAPTTLREFVSWKLLNT
jgi:hypothetical protein